MAYVRVIASDDLWDGEMQSCTVGGVRVLLLRFGETVRAYEDRCAHLGVPLSSGKLENGVITCAVHHYQYDARTGCGINPTNVALRVLPVCVLGADIAVDLGGPG